MKNHQKESIRIPGAPRNKPQGIKIPDNPKDSLFEKIEFLINKDSKMLKQQIEDSEKQILELSVSIEQANRSIEEAKQKIEANKQLLESSKGKSINKHNWILQAIRDKVEARKNELPKELQ